MKLIVLRFVLFLLLCNAFNCYAVDVNTYVPPQAFQYFTIIKTSTTQLLPNFKYPYYFPALIEHESCISLTHKKCWNPTSRLKTSREEGAGLLQLTRAYDKKTGKLRFDALNDLRKAQMDTLKDLSWSNVYQRPDLQIKAGILLTKQNYNSLFMIHDDYQRLAMTDSAYNGGLGGVQKDRMYCGLKAKCNPNLWFDNVETNSLKSRKLLYGDRSPYDINRHHVRDVLLTRMPKYKTYF